MSVAEELKKAREVIIERGWCKYDLIECGTGRVCLLGAIGIATAGVEAMENDSYDVFEEGQVAGAATQAVLAVLPEKDYGYYTPDVDERIYDFNDSDRTTQEDVLDVLDRALAVL